MSLFRKPQPEKVTIKGKPLKCTVCGHDYFLRHKAQLNRAQTSFLDLDWTDPSASCATCVNCGYLHWFLILE